MLVIINDQVIIKLINTKNIHIKSNQIGEYSCNEAPLGLIQYYNKN